MRKIWASLAASLLAVLPVQAEFNHPIWCSQITGGYRQDHFTWGFRDPNSSSSSSSSRSSSSDDEDFLFHQKIESIRIWEVTGWASYATCNNYYWRVNGGYGHIYEGHSTCESHTDMIHRHNKTSIISSDCKNGYVYDVEAAVGYQVTSNGRRFVGTPVLGYAWHDQVFKFSDAHQKVDRIDAIPFKGRIPHFNYNYRPRWYGPFVGFDFMVSVEVPCLILYGNAEWHWSGKYRASGKWRFDDLFVNNWRDKAISHGVIGNLGLSYYLGDGWYIGVVGYYRHLQAHKGRHKQGAVTNNLPLIAQGFGSMPTLGSDDDTKMNHVSWVSWSAAVTIDFRCFDP